MSKPPKSKKPDQKEAKKKVELKKARVPSPDGKARLSPPDICPRCVRSL